MILSHKYKFIFIKTPKTASSSTEIFLSKHCGDDDIVTPIVSPENKEGYKPKNFKQSNLNRFKDWRIFEELYEVKHLKPIRNFLHDEKFHNHMTAKELSFRVNKNIFNSYFKFCTVRNPWDLQVSRYYYHKTINNLGEITFDDWFKKNLDNNIFGHLDFFSDSFGNILVDQVIRYESLNEDLGKVCNKLSIPYTRLTENEKGSFRKIKRPYQEYYTEKTKHLVAERDKKMIDLFGYEF